VALIFSGRAVKLFSQMRADLPPDVDGWGLSLKGLMGMVVIGGIIISGIYWWLNRAVVPKIAKREAKKKKKGPKMSVGESFAFLAASPYIRDMATLVGARLRPGPCCFWGVGRVRPCCGQSARCGRTPHVQPACAPAHGAF
jgi:AAA family ATP:ADP antiporter